MLPLHTRADVRGVRGVAIRKVLTADEARHATFDLERCLLWRETDASSHPTAAIGDWGGQVTAGEITNPPPTGIVVSRLRHPEVVAPGMSFGWRRTARVSRCSTGAGRTATRCWRPSGATVSA